MCSEKITPPTSNNRPLYPPDRSTDSIPAGAANELLEPCWRGAAVAAAIPGSHQTFAALGRSTMMLLVGLGR